VGGVDNESVASDGTGDEMPISSLFYLHIQRMFFLLIFIHYIVG